jgi:hypothetical protein
MDEQQLDRELKKLIQAEGLEKASPGFTAKVMSQVKREKATSIAIQPIFNRKHWMILIGFILASVALSFFTNTEMPGQIGEYLADGIWNISVSKTFVYSSLIFTIFLFIQVYFIRNKLEQIYK